MVFMEERPGAWQVDDDRDRGQLEFRLFFPQDFDPRVDTIHVARKPTDREA